MNNPNYFKDIFESILDYRNVVLLIFLNKNDNDFLLEIGFSERDINLLNLEFKKNYLNNMKSIWIMLKIKKNR